MAKAPTTKRSSKREPDPIKTKDPQLENEGEGSRSASRRYDAGAEHAASNPKHVEEAAKRAQEALEGVEGPELREAEQRGRRASHR
jgi:hypothetical protein